MSAAPENQGWPPPFSVRVSERAKHPRLRVLPGKGLEVVLPRTLRPETATALVEQHKDWVRKNLDSVRVSPAVPDVLSLWGGAETLAVVCPGDNAPVTDGAGVLRLRAPRTDMPAAVRELQDWVRRHAEVTLREKTETLAERHALPYALLRFRRQRSRWGSCSSRGTVSLNICLVFLPEELARHVILHELAHTRHLNHGQGFWKTLFSLEPDALKLDKRLRSAWRFVPPWLWG